MSRSSGTQKRLAWFGFGLLLVLFVGKLFFIGYYQIPQNGMYPGLPAGSMLFTARHAYTDVADVKRGDIIVFFREINGHRANYIWRVVALPGEKVEASGESLVINGQPVHRLRLREAGGKTIFREQIGSASYEVAFDPEPHHHPPKTSVKVPSNAFFVMGDNRFAAHDSRYYGPVPFDSIMGKKL